MNGHRVEATPRIHKHRFSRERGVTDCVLCGNVWASTDTLGASSYQLCSHCGISIHTSCKSFAESCIPCAPGAPQQPSLDSSSHVGSVYVRLQHAYDINVAAGTTLYAMLKLHHNSQVHRTSTMSSGLNECIWDHSNNQHDLFVGSSFDDKVIRQSFTKFLIDESRPSHDRLKDVKLEVELWSSYMGIFDNLLARGVISLSPVLAHPNAAVERWFVLENAHSSENGLQAGKLLLMLVFLPSGDQPVVSIPSHSLAAAASEDHCDPSQVPASGSLRRSSYSALLEDINDLDDVVAMQSSEEDGVSLTVEALQATLTDIDRDDNVSTTKAERHLSAIAKVEEEESLSSVATAADGNSLGSQDPPSGRWLQAVVSLTDAATTAVGHFLYELEALTGRPPKRSLVLDGDWSDQSPSDPFTDAATTDAVGGTGVMRGAPLLGVGHLHIRIVSAFKSRVEDAGEGNHYILANVEDTSREFRSKSVFNSASPIFNVKWTIKMEHYRAAVNLFLMDAVTHQKIACSRVSVYATMQRDADRKYIHWDDAPVEHLPMRSLPIGVDTDDDLMGHFCAKVTFEEDVLGLFTGEELHDAPQAPPEQLSVQRLSAHIARFSAIFALIGLWNREYLSIMEWKDPPSTFVILLIFLYCTIHVNAEYALSGVMFLVVALMTRSLFRRNSGQYMRHYVEKGIQPMPQLDYRPVALIRVAVLGFRTARHSSSVVADTPTILQRHPSIKIMFVPMIESDAPSTASPVEAIEHTIGYFGPSANGLGFSVPHPHHQSSSQSKGQQQVSSQVSQLVSTIVGAEVVHKDEILQNVYDPLPTKSTDDSCDKAAFIKSDSADVSLVYPIVQPIRSKVIGLVTASRDRKGLEGESATEKGDGHVSVSTQKHAQDRAETRFLPWSLNEGVLKLVVLDENNTSFVGNRSDETCATLSLSQIITHPDVKQLGDRGDKLELVLWCRTRLVSPVSKPNVLSEVDLFAYDSTSTILMATPDPGGSLALNRSAGSRSTVHPSGCHETARASADSSSSPSSSSSSSSSNTIDIRVRVCIDLPSQQAVLSPTVAQSQESIALQSLWTSTLSKEKSTISVLWNMRDHVTYVQNVMNWLLDNIESSKNLFNWTAPNKTWPLYLCLVAAWLVTIAVPGRFLLLSWGLYQFFFVFIPIPEGRNFMIRCGNLLQSIANDDDLERVYASERRALLRSHQTMWKTIERNCKLNLPLKLQWCGAVSIRDGSHASSGDWTEVFMLLQARRLVWWRSAEELEAGRRAAGQLLLCGHCGITQASPMDMRKFGGECRLMAVFGSDYQGKPQKLSILCRDSVSKTELSDHISMVLQ